MRFGHWVIGAGIQSINGIKQFGNWSLRIAHCQMVIGNWSLAISHLRECLKVLKNVECLKVFEMSEFGSVYECFK